MSWDEKQIVSLTRQFSLRLKVMEVPFPIFLELTFISSYSKNVQSDESENIHKHCRLSIVNVLFRYL